MLNTKLLNVKVFNICNRVFIEFLIHLICIDELYVVHYIETYFFMFIRMQVYWGVL